MYELGGEGGCKKRAILCEGNDWMAPSHFTACSKISFIENLSHIDPSQFIWKTNQLSGFHVTEVIAERSFWTDHDYCVR